MALFSTILFLPIVDVEASSNPNLFVSAENPQFDNQFSGSMVVEVVVKDPGISDTNEGKGEPNVSINGKTLRMVQATDGNWYAYFANVDKAKAADSTVGLEGQGLDFGVFCSKDTSSSVFGVGFSETKGIAVPRSAGLGDFTNGNSPFNSCTGSPTTSSNLNNVVRQPKSINTNPNILTGQIGLDSDAWPVIQLFSFDDVKIIYNPAGPSQQISLDYDNIKNISFSLDRERYPDKADVFLTVNDIQLNQDPTDEDSWTFDIDSSPSTFYQAFDNNGDDSANGGPGLVNLVPYLQNLGFENNGKLSVNLGPVLELRTNDEQPVESVSDGNKVYSEILTLVEFFPHSGIFDNVDDSNQSNLGILDNAPRGQTGSITYDKNSLTVLTGSTSASISVDDITLRIVSDSQSLKPGTKFPVVLVDPDQNFNSRSRDDLKVSISSYVIPTMRIGNPITLEQASDVKFFTSSTDSLTGGDPANSSVPDPNSARLVVDTSIVPNGSFEKISLNLGISASELKSLLIDTSLSNSDGSNWFNYDLISFAHDLGVFDFTDTSVELSFGSLGASPVTIINPGDLSSPKDFIQLDDSDIQDIFDKSGTVFVVVNFDSSNNDVGIGSISDEDDLQPMIMDFFSFGIQNFETNFEIRNNAIYRFELEETTNNSATFDGTLEYSVANQLNILDSSFIQTLRTIDDEVKFFITDRLVDEKGISISYSDLDEVGVVILKSTKSDIYTHSGIPSLNSKSFRFGQPVTITLYDPDLNLKNDLLEIYYVINDPNSKYVDTVGKDGVVLLEILFGDIRYKRCTIDGVEYGGLGATGFTFVETGTSTGIFEGVFKMPSKICNKSGTKLISTAGYSLDAKYYDARDSSGNPNISNYLRNPSLPPSHNLPQLSTHDIVKPLSGKIQEITLSGSIENPRKGVPLIVTLTYPDGRFQNFESTITNSGGYKSTFSINENSLLGTYLIELSHNKSPVGTISFVVSYPEIPSWIKNNAKQWSSTPISDSGFVSGLRSLIDDGLVVSPIGQNSISEQKIPDWIKNNAKWWANNQISNEDFVKSIQYMIDQGIIRI
jgi:hypothetical protein